MAPKSKAKKDSAAPPAPDPKSTKKSSGGSFMSINVRHILCAKHGKKEEALAKLASGTKFDDVAREFSEDKARQGGSLGWKTRASMLPEFEKVAFELEPSSVASPKWAEVKTSEGYHIVMVEGRK